MTSPHLSQPSRSASRLILGALLAGFAVVLVILLQMRMAQGNVYSQYSSLRVDPLGSKALFEALELAEGYTSQRNIEGLTRLSGREWPQDQAPTVLFLGVDGATGWEELEATSRRLAAEGARVVLALSPAEATESLSDKEDGKEEEEEEGGEGEAGEEGESESELEQRGVGGASPDRRLRTLEFEKFAKELAEDSAKGSAKGSAKDPEPLAVELEETESTAYLDAEYVGREANAPSLPRTLPWRSAWFVDEPPTSWRVIYRLRDEPVVLTRRVGLGEIILLTDSYPFSNEALASGAPIEFLRWVLGENSTAEISSPRHVLFDEFHLGHRSAAGLVALAKRYRLGGFFAALILVAGLFVWHASAVLARPAASVRTSTLNTELPSSSALLSVLDRGLPGGELLKACAQSWQDSQGRQASSELRAEIREIAESSPDPIAGYREIRRRLHEASHPQPDPSEKGVS